MSSSGAGSPAASAPRPGSGAPATLAEGRESAYGAALFADGDGVLLLTRTGVLRVSERAPPERRSAPLGVGPALMGDAIVYWHDRKVHTLRKNGGEPRAVGLLDEPPQRFVAAEQRLAWLSRGTEGTYALATISGKTPHVLHRTRELVAAVTMLGDRVYFVEGQGGGSWRLGSVSGVPGDDGEPAFSRVHQGRTPALLVPAADGIYLYDGPTRSVRRWSRDLLTETVIAEKVICSPLAVAGERVFCGHVEGVFEIPGKGRAPRIVATETGGPITAIAADERRAAWVVDTGADRFAVRSVALARPP